MCLRSKRSVKKISDVWQCLCDEQGFSNEHYALLNQLNREVLIELIPELACCHPAGSALLKNKWLTVPDDILSLVSREYDERTRKTLNFRREVEAEWWLHELSCAVLAPLDNVAPAFLEQAELFIQELISDEERLAELIGVNDGWRWRYDLNNTLSRIVLKKADLDLCGKI